MSYEPTTDSLATHAVPDWYADAKLGIFIHWGPYSVPAWAPAPEVGHAYAEWYPYYMYREGSPTYEYHRQEYGEDVEYLDFAHEWEAENWDPAAWADFFADVGAQYVVLTGEHCDGFPLWPSHYTKYNAAEMGPERDLVGDLCEAVRDRGLRFAASYHANVNFYQPGFDGPFGHPDYHGDSFEDGRPGSEYVDFMNAKHRELIRRYDPDLLWFDVPRADAEHLHAREVIADYYTRAAERGREVLVNDRAATDVPGDIDTPEYETYDEIHERKWETCRGIGHSFGYNSTEGPEEHLSTVELVHLLVDVVSKNGNLLINVGPKADGTIPDLQREPLDGLGEWLDAASAAIFGTTYWTTPEATADATGSVDVRYTWRDDTLYAIALDWPGETLSLPIGEHVDPGSVTSVRHLTGGPVDWRTVGDDLGLTLPAEPDESAPAYAFALEGVPRGR